MKLKIVILFLLFYTGCHSPPPHMKEGYAIIHSHHKEMVQAAKWIPISIGGSYYGGDIKCLSTDFMVVQDDFNIENARELIIEGTQRFLKSINTNLKLIQHLSHYPFVSKDLKYSISICDKNFNLLGLVHTCNRKIFYSKITNPDTLTDVHEESYEEALEREGNTVTPRL
jgi:hypothetical protein